MVAQSADAVAIFGLGQVIEIIIRIVGNRLSVFNTVDYSPIDIGALLQESKNSKFY